jgi:hypothetical protein
MSMMYPNGSPPQNGSNPYLTAGSPNYGAGLVNFSQLGQAGGGLVKGAIGLAGLPGDAQNLVMNGIGALHSLIVDNIGLDPDRAAQLKQNIHDAVDSSLQRSVSPTSQQITKAVKNMIGRPGYSAW